MHCWTLIDNFKCTIQWPQGQLPCCTSTITVYSQNDFITQTETLQTLSNNSLLPFPSFQPLIISNLLFIPLYLSILDISHKCQHAIFVILCLDYFNQPNVLKGSPYYSICHNFVFFCDQIFHCMIDILFFYSSVDGLGMLTSFDQIKGK